MGDTAFDIESLLNISVNFVPMFIILFFSVYFLLYVPFDQAPAYVIATQVLLFVPFVFAGAITVIARKVIADASSEHQ
jgi:predicted membrane metal-binding protein